MIEDPRGQWAHPGKNTRIPGNQITMKGVDYPVWAVPDVGEPVLMQPGQEYTFPGASYVDEYPMLEQGGQLPTAKEGGEYETKELTNAEIEEYVKGGYIVEEELPKAQKGAIHVTDPNDPGYIAYTDSSEVFEKQQQFNSQFLANFPSIPLPQGKRTADFDLMKVFMELKAKAGDPVNSKKDRDAFKVGAIKLWKDMLAAPKSVDLVTGPWMPGHNNIPYKETLKKYEKNMQLFDVTTPTVLRSGNYIPNSTANWWNTDNSPHKKNVTNRKLAGKNYSVNTVDPYTEYEYEGKNWLTGATALNKLEAHGLSNQEVKHPTIKPTGNMRWHAAIPDASRDHRTNNQKYHLTGRPSSKGTSIFNRVDPESTIAGYEDANFYNISLPYYKAPVQKYILDEPPVVNTTLTTIPKPIPRTEASFERERERDETEDLMEKLTELGIYTGPIRGRHADENEEWQEALVKYENKDISVNKEVTHKEVVSSTPKTFKKSKELEIPEGYQLNLGYPGGDGETYGDEYNPSTAKGKTHPVPGRPTMEDYYIKYPKRRPKTNDLVSKQIGGELPKANLGKIAKLSKFLKGAQLELPFVIPKNVNFNNTIKNLSGYTQAQLINKGLIKNTDIDKLINLSIDDFRGTISTPKGELITNSKRFLSEELPETIPLSHKEYADIFNSDLDLANRIIGDHNTTGARYTIKELMPNGNLTFFTPPNQKAVNPEAGKRSIPLASGTSSFSTIINPGQWRGDVPDNLFNLKDMSSIPGLEMNSAARTVFPDHIARKGTGTYKAINEYLKKLDLGRVKSGNNIQTPIAKKLWENYIKNSEATGYYGNTNLIHGVIKKEGGQLLTAKEGGELSQDQYNDIPEFDGDLPEFVNSREHGIDTPIYVDVDIQPSKIKGAGDGLFSKQSVQEGNIIGVSHIRKQFKKNGEIYEAPFPSKMLGMYNHSDQEPNVTEVDNGDHISLIAIRDIQPGEELLSNYDDGEIQDMERSSDFIRKDVPKAKDGGIVNCEDGQCEETNEVQKLLDRQSKLRNDAVNFGWGVYDQMGYVEGEENKTGNAEKIFSEYGMTPIGKKLPTVPKDQQNTCSYYAGQLYCNTDPTINSNKFLSNYKFRNAVEKGEVPFTKTNEITDPNFDYSTLSKGDIISIKKAKEDGGGNHMMVFSHVNDDGKPVYLQSDGETNSWDWRNKNYYSGKKGASTGVFQYTPYAKEIAELEEKARTNPTYLQDNQEGGFQLELTPEEIDKYVKGGYVVEELPKANRGWLSKLAKYVRPKPIPNYEITPSAVKWLNKQSNIVDDAVFTPKLLKAQPIVPLLESSDMHFDRALGKILEKDSPYLTRNFNAAEFADDMSGLRVEPRVLDDVYPLHHSRNTKHFSGTGAGAHSGTGDYNTMFLGNIDDIKNASGAHLRDVNPTDTYFYNAGDKFKLTPEGVYITGDKETYNKLLQTNKRVRYSPELFRPDDYGTSQRANLDFLNLRNREDVLKSFDNYTKTQGMGSILETTDSRKFFPSSFNSSSIHSGDILSMLENPQHALTGDLTHTLDPKVAAEYIKIHNEGLQDFKTDWTTNNQWKNLPQDIKLNEIKKLEDFFKIKILKNKIDFKQYDYGDYKGITNNPIIQKRFKDDYKKLISTLKAFKKGGELPKAQRGLGKILKYANKLNIKRPINLNTWKKPIVTGSIVDELGIDVSNLVNATRFDINNLHDINQTRPIDFGTDKLLNSVLNDYPLINSDPLYIDKLAKLSSSNPKANFIMPDFGNSLHPELAYAMKHSPNIKTFSDPDLSWTEFVKNQKSYANGEGLLIKNLEGWDPVNQKDVSLTYNVNEGIMSKVDPIYQTGRFRGHPNRGVNQHNHLLGMTGNYPSIIASGDNIFTSSGKKRWGERTAGKLANDWDYPGMPVTQDWVNKLLGQKKSSNWMSGSPRFANMLDQSFQIDTPLQDKVFMKFIHPKRKLGGELPKANKGIISKAFKKTLPFATKFDDIVINSNSFFKTNVLKDPLLQKEMLKRLATGIEPMNNYTGDMLYELRSPEGMKRLLKQESEHLEHIGYHESFIDKQAELNYNARLFELESMGNSNNKASQANTFLEQNRLPVKSFFQNKFLYSNASYSKPNIIGDLWNGDEFNQKLSNILNTDKDLTQLGQQALPGKITMGVDFNSPFNIPVYAHEIRGHGLQRGRQLQIDRDALKVIKPKKELNENQQAAYEYWKKSGKEPSAFLNELREAMLLKGLIKHRYENITPEKLQVASTFFKRNPMGVVKSNNSKSYLSNTRVLDFMEESPEMYQNLSWLLNRLPTLGLGLGAAGAVGATLEEKKLGGELPKAWDGRIVKTGSKLLSKYLNPVNPISTSRKFLFTPPEELLRTEAAWKEAAPGYIHDWSNKSVGVRDFTKQLKGKYDFKKSLREADKASLELGKLLYKKKQGETGNIDDKIDEIRKIRKEIDKNSMDIVNNYGKFRLDYSGLPITRAFDKYGHFLGGGQGKLFNNLLNDKEYIKYGTYFGDNNDMQNLINVGKTYNNSLVEAAFPTEAFTVGKKPLFSDQKFVQFMPKLDWGSTPFGISDNDKFNIIKDLSDLGVGIDYSGSDNIGGVGDKLGLVDLTYIGKPGQRNKVFKHYPNVFIPHRRHATLGSKELIKEVKEMLAPGTNVRGGFGGARAINKYGGNVGLPKANLGKVAKLIKTVGKNYSKFNLGKDVYKHTPNLTKNILRDINTSTFGTANAIAKTIAPVMINPLTFGLQVEEFGPFTGSPLNFIPSYGKTLPSSENTNPGVAYRKFGDNLDYVKNTGIISPAHGGKFRIGKKQIQGEGNWAEMGHINERYPGTFAASFDTNVPGTNVNITDVGDSRNGVLVREGNNFTGTVPYNSIMDPGVKIHRRLPFSNKYVDINMDKLREDKFDPATMGGNLQSLLERYGYVAGIAGSLGLAGINTPQEYLDEYVNNPIKENYIKLKGLFDKPIKKEKDGGNVGVGDEVDEATMERLKAQGYKFEEI